VRLRRRSLPPIQGPILGLILGLIAVSAAAGCGSSPAGDRTARPPGSEAGSSATATLPSTTLPAVRAPVAVTPFVLDYFLRSVVRDQFGGGRHVVRWPAGEPVVVTVAGRPTRQDLRVVDRTLAAYRPLVPFPLRRGDGGRIRLHVVAKDRWAETLGDPRVDLDATGWTYTSAAGPGQTETLVGARVVVDSAADQAARDRVLAHELGHALGLGHGACRDTLMYDGPRARPLATPTRLDETMLALLYDPRLEPGMDEGQVRARLVPDATEGPTCGRVTWQLVEHRGRAYFCTLGSSSQPCTRYRGHDPSIPITQPDAWVLGGLIADYDPEKWVEYRYAGHRLLCENTPATPRPCVVFDGTHQPEYPVAHADYWTDGRVVSPRRPR
jgi:hypothetical protein